MTNKRDWPRMIPPDLRYRLNTILGQLNRPLAADVWTDLRDWLIDHNVEPPETLPEDKSPSGPGDHP